jgi:hypothetical protein
VNAGRRSDARRSADIFRRAADRIDRIRYPEATSAADQWQRVVMNRAIDAHIASLDPATRTAAEISGESHADKPWQQYTSLKYPDFDLCGPVADRGEFDVVICEQVLEHVVDPWGAAANLRELTVPGGHVIDPVSDQGARACALRVARLLAVHSTRASHSAGTRRLGGPQR